MATLSELIQETRRNLYSGAMEQMNRLNGAIDASQTNIPLKYDLGGIQRGSVIAIDLEEIQVWETSGTTITVAQRGVNGSVPAIHSDLQTVYVQPKFSDYSIFKAINEDLNDLSSPMNGLFRVITATLTYNAAVEGYDITGSTNILGILEIDYDTVGPNRSMPLITSWALRRHAPTGVFPSGNAIILYEGGFPGQSLRVRYKAPFGQFTALADTHTTVGLPDTAVDLPPLGAAMRLVGPRDVKRTFTEHQGETRRPDEVPPGSATQAMRALMMLRTQRVTAEEARLLAMYQKSLTI